MTTMTKDRLSAQDVFHFLRPEQIHALSVNSETVSYRAGDTVYFKGSRADYMYTILEGEVSLRMPGKGGVAILIEQLQKGELFGASVCLYRQTYALTAQCTQDSVLLKISGSALKELISDDCILGHALFQKLADTYFKRYIQSMEKLQAIVLNIPLEIG